GGGKKFRVLVTEARPFGLGVKTHRVLEEAGIESMIILDSAVAYAMSKVDYVMVGSEAVGIDGGLVNFIGSYQIAICAKLHGKTLYALTESFKFTRLFPLSQYDLPVHKAPLTFSTTTLPSKPSKSNLSSTPNSPIPRRTLNTSSFPEPLLMTSDQVDNNPLLDYTTPDLVGLVISDVGCLTSEGVADLLLSIFGGE
ncbi:nagb/rpia/CoA transferase-like protein, partial [Atractiella rhizophila]